MVTANAIGIIQARASSTRLPEKIFAPIADRATLLDVLAQRLESADIEWWLATTVERSDDVTAAWGEALGVRVYRGSQDDVLSRFLGVLSEADAEWCVRITADNPFTSGATVRSLLRLARSADRSVDCVHAGGEPRHYPIGFVPEVARVEALRRLDRTIPVTEAFHRTHVTSAIPEDATLRLTGELGPPRPTWRWTVDTADDLRMARAAFALFGLAWPTIEYSRMVALLDARPDITLLNSHVTQRAPEDG
jgi:spore coat polysaccharide biosynthesis protein SpsF